MRVLKYLGIGVGLIVGLVVCAGAFISIKGPSIKPPSTEKVEVTPERLARGKYLVENVTVCFNCHAERDWTRVGAPIIPGTEGAPGLCAKEEEGSPGTFCPTNITPHPEAGIGAWTDGELIRAIREGISRNGQPLAPVMPFPEYRSLSDEDVRSVVVYLRSLPPLDKRAQPSRAAFPFTIIRNLFPKPVEGPVATPAAGTPAHGEYLATVALCRPCHGSNPLSADYKGGFEQIGPWGKVAAANITPDKETGIGALSREAFIGRFKAELDTTQAATAAMHTPMPWIMFTGMTESDLGDIYAHLQSLPPARNVVPKRAAPATPAAPTTPAAQPAAP